MVLWHCFMYNIYPTQIYDSCINENGKNRTYMLNVYAICMRYSLSILLTLLICYRLVLLFNFIWIIGSNRRKMESFVFSLIMPEMNVHAPLSWVPQWTVTSGGEERLEGWAVMPTGGHGAGKSGKQWPRQREERGLSETKWEARTVERERERERD